MKNGGEEALAKYMEKMNKDRRTELITRINETFNEGLLNAIVSGEDSYEVQDNDVKVHYPNSPIGKDMNKLLDSIHEFASKHIFSRIDFPDFAVIRKDTHLDDDDDEDGIQE